MGTTHRCTVGNDSSVRPDAGRRARPPASLLLILAIAFAGCSSGAPPRRNGTGGEGGTGGSGGTGGDGGPGGTGGSGGTGGTGGTGGSDGKGGAGGSGGTGGSAEKDASVAPVEDGAST